MKHGSHHKQGGTHHHITDESLRRSQAAKIEAEPPARIQERVDLMPVNGRKAKDKIVLK
jgi:hypothetical protein